jgi:transposase
LAEGLSTELRDVLVPLLREVQSLSERIQEYDEWMEKIAQEVYPEVSLLKQVKGVGTQIALTYVLTIEDPYRFAKSREVGCFLGLRPGRRDCGKSEPQKHISKEGDRYLRTMMVQGGITFWGHLEKTVICGDGERSLPSEEEKMPRSER